MNVMRETDLQSIVFFALFLVIIIMILIIIIIIIIREIWLDSCDPWLLKNSLGAGYKSCNPLQGNFSC